MCKPVMTPVVEGPFRLAFSGFFRMLLHPKMTCCIVRLSTDVRQFAFAEIANFHPAVLAG